MHRWNTKIAMDMKKEEAVGDRRIDCTARFPLNYSLIPARINCWVYCARCDLGACMY
jgi:hypothetical protein